MERAEDGRNERRIVAFLRKGKARVGQAATGGGAILTNAQGEAIGAPVHVVEGLASAGTIRRAGGWIDLAPSGEPGINLAESPLALLATRRTRGGKAFLDPLEIDAGERLRSDYTRGRIMPRLGANWSAAVASGRRSGPSTGAVDLTDAALAARQRVDQAIDAIGPELAGVLIDVCCFLKRLEAVELERHWPARSAKLILKTALAALARHYWPQRRAAGASRPNLHWGAEDYRPRI